MVVIYHSFRKYIDIFFDYSLWYYIGLQKEFAFDFSDHNRLLHQFSRWLDCCSIAQKQHPPVYGIVVMKLTSCWDSFLLLTT